ncbi:threonine synthase [Haloferax larsenii]|uniref:Threonine synthase n=1 Tax=Haloferax larsenii TaxID=302484 RepID=A0ABY5RHG7_HALLR|nr:threonine synthase [Haloferax larsenii]UVE51604.1 threonine synthase [Haloferax larsenii]
MSAHSLPAHLRLACHTCDSTYDEWRWRCTCGAPLDFATPPSPDAATPDDADFDYRNGLWAFDEFLPTDPRATLGEGMTPLVDAPEWNASFKLEYVFPTGSFKDRGATTMLSLAAELGIDRVVEDSSGNAGAAVATYAARAGIETEIYVPASVKPSKVKAIERAGAKPVHVEGTRQDVTDACVEAVETGDAWYASHAWNPAFFAGTATVAYEIAAQRDWNVPDAIVTPLGHGTLFLGAYRGFRALRDAGWIDRVPRLYGAQAAGYAPIADARHHTPDETNDVADGIQIENPVRVTEIHEALDETGGDAVALSADAVEDELDRLHRHGFYTEPTCAVAPAALRELRTMGEIDAEDDVVVPLTGSGLKS